VDEVIAVADRILLYIISTENSLNSASALV
jgi:hypothetical protein